MITAEAEQGRNRNIVHRVISGTWRILTEPPSWLHTRESSPEKLADPHLRAAWSTFTGGVTSYGLFLNRWAEGDTKFAAVAAGVGLGGLLITCIATVIPVRSRAQNSKS